MKKDDSFERTDEEILQRMASIKRRDFLGFETDDLIECLSFKNAKQFLKEGVTETEWKEAQQPKDRKSVLKRMLDYMPFAWDKAKNCRGISASRSMSHFNSWVFLAGDDLGDLTNYEFYGKDKLVKICKFYGWDYEQWDDGVRVNSESEL